MKFSQNGTCFLNLFIGSIIFSWSTDEFVISNTILGSFELAADICQIGIALSFLVLQLYKTGFNLLLAVFNLVLRLQQLDPVIFQLLLAIFQLLVSVSQLLFGLGFAVFIFLDTVQILLVAFRVFFFGFLFHIQEALLGELLSFRLQGVQGIFQISIVGISIDFVVFFQSQIDLCVIIHIESLRRKIEVHFQRTAAHCGGTAVHVQIQWACDTAHNGEGVGAEGIQGILVIQGRND